MLYIYIYIYIVFVELGLRVLDISLLSRYLGYKILLDGSKDCASKISGCGKTW